MSRGTALYSTVSETLEGLTERLEVWKGAFESKGLTANLKRTKMMISIVVKMLERL